MANNIRVNTELDSIEFNEIKEKLKEFLRNSENSDKVKDLDFESSNIQIILDIASYIVHYLLLYLNLSISELFLEYTQIIANAITVAKSLGYRPKRRKSSKGLVEVSISDTSELIINENNSMNIPLYTKLVSPTGLKFLTLDNGVIEYDDVTEEAIPAEIECIQGELIKQEITFSNNISTFTLKDRAEVVEDGFLKVFVGGTTIESAEEYQDAFALDLQINEDSKVFYIERIENSLRIKFGVGGFGVIPENATGFIYYLKSDGVSGNNIKGTLDLEEDGSVYTTLGDEVKISDVQIDVVNAFTGGTATESLQSIKTNAPKFFGSRNRGVTESDLQAILGNLGYTVNVWGGEKEFKLTKNTVSILNTSSSSVYPIPISKLNGYLDLVIDGFEPVSYNKDEEYSYEDFIQDTYTQNILFLKDETGVIKSPNNDYDGTGGYVHWLESHEPYIGNLIVAGYKIGGSDVETEEEYLRYSPSDLALIRRELNDFKVISLKIRPITPLIISYLLDVECKKSNLFIGNGKTVIDNLKDSIQDYFNANFSGWNAEVVKSQLIDEIMNFQEVKYTILSYNSRILFFEPYTPEKIVTMRYWNGISEGTIRIPCNGYDEEVSTTNNLITDNSGVLEYTDGSGSTTTINNSYVNYNKGIIEFSLKDSIFYNSGTESYNNVLTFTQDEGEDGLNDRYSMFLTFSNSEYQNFKKEAYIKNIELSEIDLKFT